MVRTSLRLLHAVGFSVNFRRPHVIAEHEPLEISKQTQCDNGLEGKTERVMGCRELLVPTPTLPPFSEERRTDDPPWL